MASAFRRLAVMTASNIPPTQSAISPQEIQVYSGGSEIWR